LKLASYFLYKPLVFLDLFFRNLCFLKVKASFWYYKIVLLLIVYAYKIEKKHSEHKYFLAYLKEFMVQLQQQKSFALHT